MEGCIFCGIINGELPSEKVYEDAEVYAFREIRPIAPTHILVVPKRHIPSAANIDDTNSDAVSSVFAAISKIAVQQKLERGFRAVTNSGEDAGQTVGHLHFHIIGGRKLSLDIG